MAAYQPKSSIKRQRENDDCSLPLSKSQRLKPLAPPMDITTEETSTSAATATKIIDLNDDCLVKIFGHLDSENLFNVALASEFLRPAAGYVYKRKFGEKEVEITECDDFHLAAHSNACNVCASIEDWGDFITVRGLKSCLQFLRCFGSSMKYLKVKYNKSKSKRYEYVHHYIDEYCSESLNRITFWHMPAISTKRFNKAFPNVTDITFFYCDLNKELPSFVKCFRNLRHLEFHPARSTNTFEHTYFRHLEHLSIREYHQNDFDGTIGAANLLSSNRQLRSIEITVHGQIESLNTILEIIKYNSSITDLGIDFCSVANAVTSSEVKRIVSEHPLLVKLNLRDFLFTAEDAVALIDQLKSLQTFHFQVENSSDYAKLESKLDHNKYIVKKSYDLYPYQVEVHRKK